MEYWSDAPIIQSHYSRTPLLHYSTDCQRRIDTSVANPDILRLAKSRRGSQVVRSRSAKPLFAGSIPAPAFFHARLLLLPGLLLHAPVRLIHSLPRVHPSGASSMSLGSPPQAGSIPAPASFPRAAVTGPLASYTDSIDSLAPASSLLRGFVYVARLPASGGLHSRPAVLSLRSALSERRGESLLECEIDSTGEKYTVTQPKGLRFLRQISDPMVPCSDRSSVKRRR